MSSSEGPSVTERVHIGLGTNLGDRRANLQTACRLLSQLPQVQVERLSSIYETGPIGPAQPLFLNAVAELSCTLSPGDLLSALQGIETQMGRSRHASHWGPRIIDLDILLWGGQVVDAPALKIPHAELHNRRFVLEPLCELLPSAVHPVLGCPLKVLLAQRADQEVTVLS